MSPTIPLTNGILHHANGENGTSVVVEPTATFDPSVFRPYLLSLLPPVLGATPEELESIFDDEGFEEKVLRFAGESGGVIYVVKVRDTTEGT